MGDVLSQAGSVGLSVLTLVVLSLRAAQPTFLPWWGVCSIVVGLGWLLTMVSAMLKEATSEGAGHVGALFLGWVMVLIWFAPGLLVCVIIQRFPRRRTASNA